MQNTRLRSVYLLEGSQGRGRALPAYVNAAEQRKVCFTTPIFIWQAYEKLLANFYVIKDNFVNRPY